ncbi:hypothetical protein HDV01_001719 [Terramyces sp. JEL0728]|nr:hypothetical protein HDV01_001719 [Terramyces sp. JEL0728]
MQCLCPCLKPKDQVENPEPNVNTNVQPMELPTLPKKKLTAKDVTIQNITNETIIKKGIFGDAVPFQIQDCSNVKIFLQDCYQQVTVDAIKDSLVFIGPCEGSIFIRDCQNCTFICAGQQLRLRGCTNLYMNIYCNGQPIIETSSDICFSCFNFNYPELPGLFQKAGLNVYKNDWIGVYDFNGGERHWTVKLISTTVTKPQLYTGIRPDIQEKLNQKECTILVSNPVDLQESENLGIIRDESEKIKELFSIFRRI